MDGWGNVAILSDGESGSARVGCAKVDTVHDTIEQCPPRDARVAVNGDSWCELPSDGAYGTCFVPYLDFLLIPSQCFQRHIGFSHGLDMSLRHREAHPDYACNVSRQT